MSETSLTDWLGHWRRLFHDFALERPFTPEDLEEIEARTHGIMKADLPIKQLEMSIRYAKGVGPKRALLLEKLGIRTIEDALWVLPWRYEDRSIISPIVDLVVGEKATVSGMVDRTTLRRIPRRNMTVVSVFVRDGAGSIEAVFFNQPYLEKTFQTGMRVLLSGLVSLSPVSYTHLTLPTKA